MMGMFTMIAMVAQLFLGKIAFLAGAALLLSKISLLFSIVVWLCFFYNFPSNSSYWNLIAFLTFLLFFCYLYWRYEIQNALKKQGYVGGNSYSGGGGVGGAEHIVYGEPAHGGYQRSIIESPMDWVFTDEPPSTFSSISS